MLSLREKLNKAMPNAKKAVKPPPESCFVTEKRLPREMFRMPDVISRDALFLLTGEEQKDLPLKNILFLDTETTGLSGGAGTVAFETGIGYFEENEMVIRQYIMRDYDEEALMLTRIKEDLNGKTHLCTFNGKTFDVPLLTSRMIMNRMRMPENVQQLDLLHISRRVWKLRLGKCNLTRLEETVLGRERDGDLPGKDVPERYFSYLKSRDFSLLQDVLDHNFQDIASLADILFCLLQAHTEPERLKDETDLYSVGRVLAKRGRQSEARTCFRLADKGALSALSREQLALSLKKEGDWEGAARVYRAMIRDRQCRVKPYIALAKLCEHQLGDPREALKVTLDALRICDKRDEDMMPELKKRYMRLIQKQGGTE